MRSGLMLRLALPALLAGQLAGCAPEGGPAAGSGPVQAAIRARGRLICGINGQLPGFSSLAADGRYSGFDVDLCRAVAAALGLELELRPVTLAESFTAVASGEVHLLARNVTTTLGRDAPGGNGLSFAPVVFHDGGGLMAPAASGIAALPDLKGRTVCVLSGSTSEQVLADRMRQRAIPYTPLRFRSADDTFSAYLAGRCSAISSDRSGLAARRSRFAEPGEHRLLPEVLSKEPLAPATAQADPAWADQVRWVVNALIEAEERGIRRVDLDGQLARARADRSQADLRRFLGLEGDLGTSLGLPADFVVRAIRAVGHYGELYDRHLGEGSALRLERGANRLWRDGGLLLSAPFR